MLSDSAAVMSLENKVSLAKPALIDTHALIFGTARILAKDYSGAARFFEARRESAANNKDWVSWYHGFALLLDHRIEKAADNFSYLAQGSKNGIIIALSSYFLNKSMGSVMPVKAKKYLEISGTGRESVQKILPSTKEWNREMVRITAEIHGAAISKYLEETGRWIYNT